MESYENHNWAKELRKGIIDPKEMISRGWIRNIGDKKLAEMKSVFDFRIPKAYEELIDASDPSISRQVVPSAQELDFKSEEVTDPIGDEVFSPIKGITHRYADRVLLKPTYNCSLYCRFCFRRYKVSDSSNNLSSTELEAAIGYIRDTKSIREVILTGGDPLTLRDKQLDGIFRYLNEIDHVEIIRIHTRIPSSLPERVNSELLSIIEGSPKSVWWVVHINSASELQNQTMQALRRITRAGIPILCQSVLLKGINDSEEALHKLFSELIKLRVQPYYLHYPDLAKGTDHFRIPLTEAINLMTKLQGKLSGYALPKLIVDLPGGKGKVALPSHSVSQRDANTWEFKSPLTGERVLVSYPENETE